MKKLLVVLLISISLVTIAMVWLVMQDQPGADIGNYQAAEVRNYQKIDAVIDGEIMADLDTISTEVAVYQMPQFILALPKKQWFDLPSMQSLGGYLGLTSQAKVENLGVQYMWQENEKMFLANPSVGFVKFTTAFNLVEKALEPISAADQIGSQKVLELLATLNFPTNFYDLDNLAYSYYSLDAGGVPYIVEDVDQATLVRVDIPYVVSGVRIILPIESFIFVGANSEIFNMTLFVPNIEQGAETLELVSTETAREWINQGVGVVLEKKIATSISQLAVDELYPAYYLNYRDFYDQTKPRKFTPLYVFEGQDGLIAVVADAK